METRALPVIEKVIEQDQLARYADVSGDHNLLHLDPEFAAGTRFGGIIAHGMLTLAFVSEMMTTAFGASWLESGRLKVRFKGAAYPGDTLRTWGQVVKDEPNGGHRVLECSVGLKNGRGDELIGGSAFVTQRREDV